jgi:hypothetical protein
MIGFCLTQLVVLFKLLYVTIKYLCKYIISIVATSLWKYNIDELEVDNLQISMGIYLN